MGREFELKYQAAPEVLAALQQKFGGFVRISMETAYYDTPDGVLSRKQWMLRRRLENGVSVCTLKTPRPDGSRGEWNVEAPDILSGLYALCKLDTPIQLASLNGEDLIPVCAARFTRLAATLVLGDCTVELALDRGEFLGGGKIQPFSEVEVELKDGSEAAAAAFAQSLAGTFSLNPEPKSKVQRAMELACSQETDLSVPESIHLE